MQLRPRSDARGGSCCCGTGGPSGTRSAARRATPTSRSTRSACAQAARAAELLATYEPAFVWSSDLARARQTAEALAALTGHEIGARPAAARVRRRCPAGHDVRRVRGGVPGVLSRASAPASTSSVPGAEITADSVGERMLAVLERRDQAVGERRDRRSSSVMARHCATGILAFFGVPRTTRRPRRRRARCSAGMANCAWTVLEQHRDRGWQIVDYNAQTLPEPVSLRRLTASTMNGPRRRSHAVRFNEPAAVRPGRRGRAWRAGRR